VEWIDNNFILNKKEFKKKVFDENIFMYYETYDLCKRISKFQKKMYVCKELKYIHLNTGSTDNKFSFLYKINKDCDDEFIIEIPDFDNYENLINYLSIQYEDFLNDPHSLCFKLSNFF
jgi:hypothetical protein